MEILGAANRTKIASLSWLSFDGVDDVVDIGAVLQPSYTKEAWILVSSTGTALNIVSGNASDAHAFLKSAGDQLRAGHNGSGFSNVEDPNPLPIGVWQHVAVTYDNATGEMILYRNGVVVDQAAAVPAYTRTSGQTFVGGYSVGNFFHGNMDEVRIWSTVRTAQQIRENMHLTLSACEAGLEVYYQMNEGAGSTLVDATGNQNGSISGSPVWAASGANVGNDAAAASNSQSLSVPTGASTQNFASTNLSIDFLEHDVAEDFTVTYQAFTPNVTTGANGVTVFDNPTWTINKATATSSQNFNLTFTLPSAFSATDGTKYRLLWRPMNSDGGWAVVKGQAASVSGNDISFENLFETGQYMVEQFSAGAISDVRGNMATVGSGTLTGSAAGITGGTFTAEAWLKREASAGLTLRVSDGTNSCEVFVFSSGDVTVAVNSATGSRNEGIPSIIPADEWTHLAVSYDAGADAIVVYINGVNVPLSPAFSSSSGSAPLLNGGDLNIFNLASGVVALDEVRIWSDVRTEQEIRENMHLTLRETPAQLLRYFQFNTATLGEDVSSSAQNLSVAGGTVSSVASEVAVAGGVSQQILAGALTGTTNFSETGVSVTFNTIPADDIVVYRLQTEPPAGISGINVGYALDDQYYVIRNFGTATPDVTAINFDGIGYVDATDVGVAGAFELYKRPSNSFSPADWALANAGGTNGQATASGPAAPVNFPASFSGFSQFIILNSSGSSTLPIELLNFQAQRATATQVALNWSTATEINASHFEVERMLDNEEVFTKVGEVTAAGNSNSFQAYAFQDANAHQGLSYYRLKQVDEDGSFEYSEMRAVAGKELDRQVAVFPNPVDDILQLRLSDLSGQQQVDVRIVNNLGQVVFQGQRTFGQADVLEIREVAGLVPGAYYLQLNWGAEQVALPFVKR